MNIIMIRLTKLLAFIIIFKLGLSKKNIEDRTAVLEGLCLDDVSAQAKSARCERACQDQRGFLHGHCFSSDDCYCVRGTFDHNHTKLECIAKQDCYYVYQVGRNLCTKSDQDACAFVCRKWYQTRKHECATDGWCSCWQFDYGKVSNAAVASAKDHSLMVANSVCTKSQDCQNVCPPVYELQMCLYDRCYCLKISHDYEPSVLCQTLNGVKRCDIVYHLGNQLCSIARKGPCKTVCTNIMGAQHYECHRQDNACRCFLPHPSNGTEVLRKDRGSVFPQMCYLSNENCYKLCQVLHGTNYKSNLCVGDSCFCLTKKGRIEPKQKDCKTKNCYDDVSLGRFLCGPNDDGACPHMCYTEYKTKKSKCETSARECVCTVPTQNATLKFKNKIAEHEENKTNSSKLRTGKKENVTIPKLEVAKIQKSNVSSGVGSKESKKTISDKNSKEVPTIYNAKSGRYSKAQAATTETKALKNRKLNTTFVVPSKQSKAPSDDTKKEAEKYQTLNVTSEVPSKQSKAPADNTKTEVVKHEKLNATSGNPSKAPTVKNRTSGCAAKRITLTDASIERIQRDLPTLYNTVEVGGPCQEGENSECYHTCKVRLAGSFRQHICLNADVCYCLSRFGQRAPLYHQCTDAKCIEAISIGCSLCSISARDICQRMCYLEFGTRMSACSGDNHCLCGMMIEPKLKIESPITSPLSDDIPRISRAALSPEDLKMLMVPPTETTTTSTTDRPTTITSKPDTTTTRKPTTTATSKPTTTTTQKPLTTTTTATPRPETSAPSTSSPTVTTEFFRDKREPGERAYVFTSACVYSGGACLKLCLDKFAADFKRSVCVNNKDCFCLKRTGHIEPPLDECDARFCWEAISLGSTLCQYEGACEKMCSREYETKVSVCWQDKCYCATTLDTASNIRKGLQSKSEMVGDLQWIIDGKPTDDMIPGLSTFRNLFDRTIRYPGSCEDDACKDVCQKRLADQYENYLCLFQDACYCLKKEKADAAESTLNCSIDGVCVQMTSLGVGLCVTSDRACSLMCYQKYAAMKATCKMDGKCFCTIPYNQTSNQGQNDGLNSNRSSNMQSQAQNQQPSLMESKPTLSKNPGNQIEPPRTESRPSRIKPQLLGFKTDSLQFQNVAPQIGPQSFNDKSSDLQTQPTKARAESAKDDLESDIIYVPAPNYGPGIKVTYNEPIPPTSNLNHSHYKVIAEQFNSEIPKIDFVKAVNEERSEQLKKLIAQQGADAKIVAVETGPENLPVTLSNHQALVPSELHDPGTANLHTARRRKHKRKHGERQPVGAVNNKARPVLPRTEVLEGGKKIQHFEYNLKPMEIMIKNRDGQFMPYKEIPDLDESRQPSYDINMAGKTMTVDNGPTAVDISSAESLSKPSFNVDGPMPVPGLPPHRLVKKTTNDQYQTAPYSTNNVTSTKIVQQPFLILSKRNVKESDLAVLPQQKSTLSDKWSTTFRVENQRTSRTDFTGRHGANPSPYTRTFYVKPSIKTSSIVYDKIPDRNYALDKRRRIIKTSKGNVTIEFAPSYIVEAKTIPLGEGSRDARVEAPKLVQSSVTRSSIKASDRVSFPKVAKKIRSKRDATLKDIQTPNDAAYGGITNNDDPHAASGGFSSSGYLDDTTSRITKSLNLDATSGRFPNFDNIAATSGAFSNLDNLAATSGGFSNHDRELRTNSELLAASSDAITNLDHVPASPGDFSNNVFELPTNYYQLGTNSAKSTKYDYLGGTSSGFINSDNLGAISSGFINSDNLGAIFDGITNLDHLGASFGGLKTLDNLGATSGGFRNLDHLGATSGGITNLDHLGATSGGITNLNHLGATSGGFTNLDHLGATSGGFTNLDHLGATSGGFTNMHNLGATSGGFTNLDHLGATSGGFTNLDHLGATSGGFRNLDHLGATSGGFTNLDNLGATSGGFTNLDHLGATSGGFPNQHELGVTSGGFPNQHELGVTSGGFPNQHELGVTSGGFLNQHELGVTSGGFPNQHELGVSSGGFPNQHELGVTSGGFPNQHELGVTSGGFPNQHELGVTSGGFPNQHELGVTSGGFPNQHELGVTAGEFSYFNQPVMTSGEFSYFDQPGVTSGEFTNQHELGATAGEFSYFNQPVMTSGEFSYFDQPVVTSGEFPNPHDLGVTLNEFSYDSHKLPDEKGFIVDYGIQGEHFQFTPPETIISVPPIIITNPIVFRSPKNLRYEYVKLIWNGCGGDGNRRACRSKCKDALKWTKFYSSFCRLGKDCICVSIDVKRHVFRYFNKLYNPIGKTLQCQLNEMTKNTCSALCQLLFDTTTYHCQAKGFCYCVRSNDIDMPPVIVFKGSPGQWLIEYCSKSCEYAVGAWNIYKWFSYSGYCFCLTKAFVNKVTTRCNGPCQQCSKRYPLGPAIKCGFDNKMLNVCREICFNGISSYNVCCVGYNMCYCVKSINGTTLGLKTPSSIIPYPKPPPQFTTIISRGCFEGEHSCREQCVKQQGSSYGFHVCLPGTEFDCVCVRIGYEMAKSTTCSYSKHVCAEYLPIGNGMKCLSSVQKGKRCQYLCNKLGNFTDFVCDLNDYCKCSKEKPYSPSYPNMPPVIFLPGMCKNCREKCISYTREYFESDTCSGEDCYCVTTKFKRESKVHCKNGQNSCVARHPFGPQVSCSGNTLSVCKTICQTNFESSVVSCVNSLDCSCDVRTEKRGIYGPAISNRGVYILGGVCSSNSSCENECRRRMKWFFGISACNKNDACFCISKNFGRRATTTCSIGRCAIKIPLPPKLNCASLTHGRQRCKFLCQVAAFSSDVGCEGPNICFCYKQYTELPKSASLNLQKRQDPVQTVPGFFTGTCDGKCSRACASLFTSNSRVYVSSDGECFCQSKNLLKNKAASSTLVQKHGEVYYGLGKNVCGNRAGSRFKVCQRICHEVFGFPDVSCNKENYCACKVENGAVKSSTISLRKERCLPNNSTSLLKKDIVASMTPEITVLKLNQSGSN